MVTAGTTITVLMSECRWKPVGAGRAAVEPEAEELRLQGVRDLAGVSGDLPLESLIRL